MITIKNHSKFIKLLFPKGNWIDLDTYDSINVTNDAGVYKHLKPREKIIKHLRPGYSVFVQDPLDSSPLSTKILLTLPFNLLVNLDAQSYSKGSILQDNKTATMQITK